MADGVAVLDIAFWCCVACNAEAADVVCDEFRSCALNSLLSKARNQKQHSKNDKHTNY